MIRIIAEQMELSPELPVVIGNVDYQEFARRLKRIDEMLGKSGIERRFIESQLREINLEDKKGQEKHQKMCRKALRCAVRFMQFSIK